jgi:hypothetical protein
MKLSFEKELAIKKAILYGTENNVSIANYADGFGVSKSTIYKYRRILVEQGFIAKEFDGSYSIVENKYSKKISTKPKVHTLDLSFNDDEYNGKYSDETSNIVDEEVLASPYEGMFNSSENESKQYTNNTVSESNVELVIVNNKNNDYKRKAVQEVSKNKNFVKTILSKLTRR